jgi:hypothetical protein
VKRILEDKARKANGEPSNYYSAKPSGEENDSMQPGHHATSIVRGKRASGSADQSSLHNGPDKRVRIEHEAVIPEERIKEIEKRVSERIVQVLREELQASTSSAAATLKEGIQAITSTVSTTQAMVKEGLEAKGVSEQRTIEENKLLRTTNKSLEQTDKGVYTKQINQANKERDAAIKERDEIAMKIKILLAEAKTPKRQIEQISGNGYLDDFKTVMEELDKSIAGKQTPRGTQLTATQTFSPETYQRVFAVVMSKALDNTNNCSDSPSRHRFVLGKYNGPIFSKMAVDELISACLKIITWMCEKLQIEVPANLVGSYTPISGDPFSLPEVWFYTLFLFFINDELHYRW